ncbi:histidine phosphatase family protein [Kitasatospora sp. NPDC085879]|jgi:probable phosphomutase (TIGR03848 family)|uniref:histidine phosphatase family protein n=1 Tax=Kitasatospora sp. NPDC085879 TaxID=3154769 RepID=UPI000BB13FE8|nr:histidine phosphatase family protein [Streptomyces sp. TLI_235]PBC76512.1 putative phosphomutase (TIGR03848 family) [Streptomyces sp. TLI_235]
MPTLLLVRHGRSTANTAGVLAGWTPGVDLDDTGREQAAGLVGRLSGLPVAHAVSSPLERCRQTLAPLLAARPELGDPAVDERLGECRYGDWTGRPLRELAQEPLWRTVQDHASAAAFPGGESLRDLSHRTVDAVREWDARVAAEHGENALWIACTHGDVIKAVVADALGLHLDQFQRISVEPCSVTAIRYTPHRPFLLRLGDTGGLGSLAPREEPSQVPGGDAVVGGTS